MKVTWKPGNMLYPIPAVLISTRGTDGKDNLMTVAWTGTVCTNPPMLYISVRKNRYSYRALHETGVFGLNLTTEDLAFAADYCGVVSGPYRCSARSGEPCYDRVPDCRGERARQPCDDDSRCTFGAC